MTDLATVAEPGDRCPRTDIHGPHEWYGAPAAIRRNCIGVLLAPSGPSRDPSLDTHPIHEPEREIDMESRAVQAKRWPTALLIPCPRKGADDESRPLRYRAWFWLYRTIRVMRHRAGLHDFEDVPAWIWNPQGGKESYRQRCDWCGARR